MLDPGTYKATVHDYGFTYSQKGDLQVMIIFNTEYEYERPVFYSWWKSEKSKYTSMKFLKKLGYKQPTLIKEFAAGPRSGLLDETIEVNIVIEHHVNDETGKKYQNVAGIYLPGEEDYRGPKKIDEKEAERKLNELKSEASSSESSGKNLDELPF